MALPRSVSVRDGPNGDYQFVEAPPSDTKSLVSSDLQSIAVDQRTTAVAAGGFQIASFATGKQEMATYQGVQADDPHWSGDGRLLWYQDENTQYLHRVGGGTVILKSAAGEIVDMAYTSDAMERRVRLHLLPHLRQLLRVPHRDGHRWRHAADHQRPARGLRRLAGDRQRR